MLKRHEVQVLRRAGHTWKEIAALSGSVYALRPLDVVVVSARNSRRFDHLLEPNSIHDGPVRATVWQVFDGRHRGAQRHPDLALAFKDKVDEHL